MSYMGYSMDHLGVIWLIGCELQRVEVMKGVYIV